MDELELKQYLKNHLTISIDTRYVSYDGNKLEVKLMLDDEVISSDYISVSYLQED